nr:hypothetical protein CFP56_52095 [Quercus suber]
MFAAIAVNMFGGNPLTKLDEIVARLLRLKGSSSSLTNICPKIECLTDRIEEQGPTNHGDHISISSF